MSSLNKRTFGWLGLAIAGACAGLTPPAHAQELDWIRQFGTSATDLARALAPDGAGGVMVAGSTFGNLGGQNAGIADPFLARYDSAGEQLWIRQFGTNESESAYALAPDGAGGVLVAGYTAGSLGGQNAGSRDAFLARYDSAGQQLWIRQFGTSSREEAWALAPDGAGGVMVAGYTTGSLGGQNAGGYDAFLARYDSAGEQLWVRQFGTSRLEWANALTPDGAGGVMVAGNTAGNLGGQNAGDRDAFLARYDSAGERIWIRQFGTSERDYAYALAPDGTGGVMVAGFTSGSLGGPNAGDRDAFLARFDSAGDQLWIRQFGTSENDYARGLAPDGAGSVMVAGYTRGSLGGQNAGESDAYLARFIIDSCGPCDTNCDGSVDLTDVEPFIALLLEGDEPCDACAGDANNDGSIDLTDVEAFIACLLG